MTNFINSSIWKTQFVSPIISPITFAEFGEFGDFSLNKFLTRFLCGGPALKECRQVSRLQLALVESGIDVGNLHANLLHNTINQYCLAKQKIMSSAVVSKETLCAANKIILPNRKNAGQIRTTQNWVGQSLKEATHVPPAPEHLHKLLDDYIQVLNTTGEEGLDKAVSLYARFLILHPFGDGNGRISRMLLEKACSLPNHDSDLNSVHLSLYRLSNDVARYQEAVLAFGVSSDKGLHHPYWQQAADWTKNYRTRASQILSQTKSIMIGKLALSQVDSSDRTIIDLLWSKPLVTPKIIHSILSINTEAINSTLIKLTSLGILKPYRLRNLNGQQVYVCEEIFSAWKKLDELVFANKIE